jgi:hypothetical protein
VILRRFLGVCVLSAACASSEAPATPPAPAAAAVAAAKGDPAWHWKSEALAAATAAPGYLLGVVGQSGVEHCPDGGYEGEWLALRPAIGRVTVSGPEDSVFDPLMDQPVLALGQPAAAPPSGPSTATAPTQPCAPVQMRSDWRMTPRGFVVERGSAPAVEHFRVDAVRPLRELEAQADGDHVVVTLRNPVPVALADVELHVHYEGCFGKPGTTVETQAIGDFGVGAKVVERVPMLSGRADAPEGRSLFRAYSVQLVGRGEGVVIDLDVPLEQLGVEVECPNR